MTTKAGLLTFEGDAGLATETATFNDVALTDALNPVGNAMNSTIESGGAPFTAKSPNYANQLGMDLDVFPNPGALANDQTTAHADLQLDQRVLHALGLLPRLRRGPGDEQRPAEVGAPGRRRLGARRPDAERRPRQLERHGHATYAYQWQRCDAAGNNCQDIPGATGSTYTPSAADVGGHRPRRRHRHQRRRHVDAHRLRADRRQRARAAGQHHAAGPLRPGRRRASR